MNNMNTVEFMNVLSGISKSRTHREAAIIAGIGILVIGGVCYYYYSQNQELKRTNKNYLGQMSKMNSTISSLEHSNINIQDAFNRIYADKLELMNQIQMIKIKVSKKDQGDENRV